MTKYNFSHAAALGALVFALAVPALPASAQDDGKPNILGGEAAEPRGPVVAIADQRQDRGQAPGWGGGRDRSESRPQRSERRDARPDSPRAAIAPPERTERREWRREAPPSAAAPVQARNYGADRNTSYTAPRDRSYGGDRRRGEDRTQRRADGGSWVAPAARAAEARRGDWQGNRGTTDRRNDWQRERRDDARNYANGYRDGRRADSRDDRRDRQRAYAQGYRAGDRSDDGRYGRDFRRWDNRSWRNDNRYDWYRYRAANRSLFSLGRYYAPYRDYRYSRISIGFRLGSLFYGNRYWINDPWRYRLPDVYGPYRWVRYYDDALLVDVYSGEVVDVIYDFFW